MGTQFSLHQKLLTALEGAGLDAGPALTEQILNALDGVLTDLESTRWEHGSEFDEDVEGLENGSDPFEDNDRIDAAASADGDAVAAERVDTDASPSESDIEPAWVADLDDEMALGPADYFLIAAPRA